MTGKPDLLLVGSVPLETAEDVMSMLGALGPHLRSLPDGEVGARKWWVLRIAIQVLHGHQHLRTVNRPAPDGDVERLVPRDLKDFWRFEVADGVETVNFCDPGWRLGFTRDAVQSYFVFRTLREKKLIPDGVRFQVSIPLVNSAISTILFPRPGDIERVRRGYEAALRAEVAKIVELIPNEDLAIQWDCAWEVTDVYGGLPGLPREGALERNIPQVAALSAVVPEAVALGFHFCFGTFGGWPRFAPEDLNALVDLANAAALATGRKVDWVHIPVLPRLDEDYYSALARLKPANARIYLGMIHNMPHFAERLALARKYLPEFGLAAPCGLGRHETNELPSIIADHISALNTAASMT